MLLGAARPAAAAAWGQAARLTAQADRWPGVPQRVQCAVLLRAYSHRAGPLATACAAGTGARLLSAQDWPLLQQLRPVLLQPIAKRAALPTVVGAAPGFAPGELSASLSLSPASPNRVSMGSTSSHRTSSSSSLSAPQLVVPNEYDMVL